MEAGSPSQQRTERLSFCFVFVVFCFEKDSVKNTDTRAAFTPSATTITTVTINTACRPDV